MAIPFKPFRSAFLLVFCCSYGFAATPSQVVQDVIARARHAEQLHQEAIAKAVPAYVMIEGGSGVTISPDGLMLTNHHVIQQKYERGMRNNFDVRVGDRFFKADVLGTDPRGDIALLQVKNSGSLPFIEFGDSDQLVVGQQVMAIGNPFGAMEGIGDPTVTLGVISCLHRFRDSYSDAIQTDTPINPGNSGGPLLTMDGKLIGINGRIQSRHGARANTGIGLAIPTNQIARFLPHLKSAKGGLVHHAEIRGLVGEMQETDGFQNGAEIKSVQAGSPAEKMGLKTGDRVTHVEELPIRNFARLLGVIGTYPADSEVKIKLERGGRTETIKVKLELLDRPALGFTIVGQHLTRENAREAIQMRQKLQKDPEMKMPVKIETVDKNLPAAKSGLKAGDIIESIEGKEIVNPLKFELTLRELAQKPQFVPGYVLKLVVDRNGKKENIDLPLGSSVASAEARLKETEKKK